MLTDEDQTASKAEEEEAEEEEEEEEKEKEKEEEAAITDGHVETYENENFPEHPKCTLQTPTNSPRETDTEEDLFSQKMNDMASVPIKAIFNTQQQTEQLDMIQETD